MKSFITFSLHLVFIILLTIVTQVGGLIWLVLIFIVPKRNRQWLLPAFLFIYIGFTFFVVPPLALIGGRVALPISKSGKLAPHNYLTIILNCHYVNKQLFNELKYLTEDYVKYHPSSKVLYLDANFPFIDGFPLLPHRSHDDGKKIDLAFLYSDNGVNTNSKPSRLGYGYFENPLNGEWDQPQDCFNRGHWQYDFTKYITFGSTDQYTFDEERTKALLEIILNRSKTHKVFIEPHLKNRLNITHTKCRYHGCNAVRHDDHIHYQVK